MLASTCSLRGFSPWVTLSWHLVWASVGASSHVSSTPGRMPGCAALTVSSGPLCKKQAPICLHGCFKAGMDRQHQVFHPGKAGLDGFHSMLLLLAFSLISYCIYYHFQIFFTRSLPNHKLWLLFFKIKCWKWLKLNAESDQWSQRNMIERKPWNFSFLTWQESSKYLSISVLARGKLKATSKKEDLSIYGRT